MNNHEQLTPAEKEAFEALRQPVQPDIHLEERIVKRLKDENLISKTPAWKDWGLKIAASIALIAVGIIIGKIIYPPMETQSQFNYMLVLYEDGRFTPSSPEEMFTEYSKWMEGIQEQGVTIGGQEMKPSSLFLEPDGTQVSDDNVRRVGGYFVINAGSLDQAMKIAQDSPHLKYGGSIEVKEFMIR
ncbi:hypothetical protein JMN32_02080 [Fulvivirga sp. 29W222]|uniref:YCII-related domain-containing protein n=1 Tax=Fulvivirga marina TaxID=2494733 RepID=A0A937FV39_9BACT|nr:YciI family protein [Fulvivirga marina]MBL6445077.1 hypothetical protein [Fulvivirga marina]